MTEKLLQNKRWATPVTLLLLADILILLPLSPEIRLVGATILLFGLPGWVLLEAFFPHPAELVARLTLAVGLSFSLSILGMLYLVYLPGRVAVGGVMALENTLVLILLATAFIRRSQLPPLMAIRQELLLVLAVVSVAFLIRLPMMGYSEFHEDEVEVASFASRVLAGEDYSIYLHRKGPAQTLLPVMVWLTTNRATEPITRFPFTLASGFGVLGIYILGRQLRNRTVGSIAALLMAVNGYSVGFGRMVQYQALIFLLGPLIVWALWTAFTERRLRWIVPGLLMLSIDLLAHFDTLLYVPVVLYLLGIILLQARKEIAPALGWIAAAGLLALAVLASFYIPYVRDPQFAHTLSYLTETRVGDNRFYNNLPLFQYFDEMYNSRLYLPLLFGLTAVFPLFNAKKWAVHLGIVLTMLLAASTGWLRNTWMFPWVDLAFLPWVLVAVLGWWVTIRRDSAGALVWVWWFSSFAGYVFLVDRPGTHFYIAYSAWVILAAMGAWGLWSAWGSRVVARYGLMLSGIALLVALAFYQTLLFWHTDSEYRQTLANWEQNPTRLVYGSLPDSYLWFGAPRRIGWKAVGWLVHSRVFPSDFRSANEAFSVPIWYTFQTPRSCYNDPQVYFVADTADGRPPEIENYTRWGKVMVEGKPRILIFGKTAQPAETDYSLAQLAPRFDAAAQPQQFVGLPRLENSGRWYFGDAIDLVGYSISRQDVAPGEMIEVDLQWRAQADIPERYRAFVHLEKEQIWGQSDEDPACRLPTTLWRKGQLAQGQFRVTVDPATPPGDYPLTIGLYNPNTWQRLPIFDEQGQPIGDTLQVATIKVVN